MKITLDFLASRNACYGGRENFLVLFGTEVEFNKENILKYIKAEKYAFQDFRWLANNILEYPERKKFFEFYYKYNQRENDTDKFAYAIAMKLKELLECI